MEHPKDLNTKSKFWAPPPKKGEKDLAFIDTYFKKQRDALESANVLTEREKLDKRTKEHDDRAERL